MHTLVLWTLCFACIAGNAVQWHRTRTFRTVGLMVCGAWALQQFIWRQTGQDSLIVFAACDLAIIATALRGDALARLIIALMPVGWACIALAWWSGPSPSAWWINWGAVVLQMLLGLPWGVFENAGPNVSHGPLRAGLKA